MGQEKAICFSYPTFIFASAHRTFSLPRQKFLPPDGKETPSASIFECYSEFILQITKFSSLTPLFYSYQS